MQVGPTIRVLITLSYIYMLNLTVKLTPLKVKLEDLLLKKATSLLNGFDNPYMGEVPVHGGVPFIWNTPDKGSALVIPYPNFRICMFLFFLFSFFFFLTELIVSLEIPSLASCTKQNQNWVNHNSAPFSFKICTKERFLGIREKRMKLLRENRREGGHKRRSWELLGTLPFHFSAFSQAFRLWSACCPPFLPVSVYRNINSKKKCPA